MPGPLAAGDEVAFLSAWEFETGWAIPEVAEPSGLCFHPVRNSIYAVDDGALDRLAAVFELDMDCKILQKKELGGDLEGICFCPSDGLLYVVDESAEKVLKIEPAGLELLGEVTISRSFAGADVLKEGGNGFEGIEYIPETAGSGYLLLLNQDDPHALIRIELNELKENLTSGTPVAMSSYWPLPPINAGELHYNSLVGELWVVNSWMNVMQAYDPECMELLRWEVVPGAAQEGMTIDSQGRLWIGSDSGGIARYRWRGEL
jgi:uncharacterized protein YjiK